jgi:bidirectional [NiFe] hydrogenase diaphorase subunit
MAILTLTIDGQAVSCRDDETLLTVARQHGIEIPTLCHLDGLGDVGACRFCLVEIEWTSKLLPACTTKPTEGMVVRTSTEKLKRYRRLIVEMLASEGNHHCAVCVSNQHCELQNLAGEVGLQSVRVPYLYPDKKLDATHGLFVMDHNRCVLCTRCVRVCHEVEGAHTWDLGFRGIKSEIIAGLNVPWGSADTCTSCGKCVSVCPTGALFAKGATVAEMEKRTHFVKYLVTARRSKEWVRDYLASDEEGEE